MVIRKLQISTYDTYFDLEVSVLTFTSRSFKIVTVEHSKNATGEMLHFEVKLGRYFSGLTRYMELIYEASGYPDTYSLKLLGRAKVSLGHTSLTPDELHSEMFNELQALLLNFAPIKRPKRTKK